MSLLKFGSLLKIASTGLALEDVMTEKVPSAPAAKEIEKKNNEFLYFRARAISAGDQGPEKGIPNPNGNGDYFPRKELEASFNTFAGRQLFLNHESDHPIKSIGKILDAYEVEDPETGEYYVECLAKIDRKLHPEMARKVETGELNTVSMGCSCEASMCSVCGTTIHTDNDEKCAHLEPSGILKQYTAEVDLPQYGIKKGSSVIAFSINSGLVFNELSIVNVPADSAAFIKTVIASNLKNKISKKASLDETEKIHLQALLDSLDEVTKAAIKEEFCACSIPKEEQKMSDKEIKSEIPVEAKSEDTVNDVLQKLNGLEYMRLSSWMEKKMVKASAPIEAEKKEEKEEKKDGKDEKEAKEASVVDKAIESVKHSFLGKLFSKAVKEEISKASTPTSPTSRELRAQFAKADVFGDSSWTLFRGDKKILRAFVKNAFNAEDLKDMDVTTWIASKEYGDKLVATYKEIGFVKTAHLLGVGFKKVEAANPAEKDRNKSEKALDAVDQTEVGKHLDSSKPEGEKEAAKVETQEKKADFPPMEDKPMDAPKEEVKVVDNVEEALPTDAPKPEIPGEEKHESAFDKIEDKLIISEGVEAHKDKETNEIVVTDASGSEMKRLPDGFGDDVPTVLKLLQSIVGVESEKEEMAPAAPQASPVEEEPKVEEPASSMIPDMNKEQADTASKVDNLSKKAEELAKKEAELKKIEQRINAEKFSSALNARTERCKKIVSTMLSKDLLPMDEATLTAELQKGETLLDARKTALEVAIKNKVKALLANDDSSLNSVEVTIQGLKKSASKLSTPVSLGYVVHTEDDDLNSIFNSMGK